MFYNKEYIFIKIFFVKNYNFFDFFDLVCVYKEKEKVKKLYYEIILKLDIF